MRVRDLSSRSVEPQLTGDERSRDVFWAWPRRPSTAAALIALVLVQGILFFAVTQRSFFFADDYNYFKLAEERSFVRYLLTPVLGVYPAPGDRLASFVLQKVFPLDFTAARTILMVFLAATTIVLWQLVRTFARSDHWWTVALLVPFALSVTLVVPLSWWSAGIPILPALFFTVVALSAWYRSYVEPRSTFWIGVAVVAVAAAGAFHVKFLLIPAYLLFFRLWVLPALLDLPRGIRGLWDERMRWLAVGAPAVLFLAVLVASGRASSPVGGARPYLDYFATAWFRAVIPASFLNARIGGSGPAIPPWVIVLVSQAVFWGLVAVTWRRSALAARGWALFAFVFSVNVAMIGTVRLTAFGVDIAYDLRYYPEIVLFLPLALALGFRKGAERRQDVVWEETTVGRTAIALLACFFVASFVVWAPGIVSDSPGVRARSWYENLRADLGVLMEETVPRVVDSETPEFVMPGWMATDNRVSTITELVPLEVVYNELTERTYLVLGDGHLAEAAFRTISPLVSGSTLGEGVQIQGGHASESSAMCLGDGDRIFFRPDADVTAERLALRVFYSEQSRSPVRVVVDAQDPDRPFRYVELRPFRSVAELIDLGASRVRAVTWMTSPGDETCIERMDIGSLTARDD